MRHDAARRGEENGAAEELLATSSPRTRELIAGDHWLGTSTVELTKYLDLGLYG